MPSWLFLDYAVRRMKENDRELSNFDLENVNTSERRRKQKIYELYTVLKFYITKSTFVACSYAIVVVIIRTRGLYNPYTAFHYCLFHILYHMFILWFLHICVRIFEATIRSRMLWWFRCCEKSRKGEFFEDEKLDYNSNLLRIPSRETFAGKALHSVRTFFGASSLNIDVKATSQPTDPNLAPDGDTKKIDGGKKVSANSSTINPLYDLKKMDPLESGSKSVAKS